MKELDALRKVVSDVIAVKLEPVVERKQNLEAGMAKQVTVREKHSTKYEGLVVELSQGKDTTKQITKAGREHGDADLLIKAYTGAIEMVSKELNRYEPVSAQVRKVLTGAANCIEIKRLAAQLMAVNRDAKGHEKQLKAEMHGLGMKSKKLLELMDTPKVAVALSKLLQAVIDFEIVIKNPTEDFDANQYLPSTNNKTIKALI